MMSSKLILVLQDAPSGGWHWSAPGMGVTGRGGLTGVDWGDQGRP